MPFHIDCLDEWAEEQGSCWIWTRALSKNGGYGMVHWAGRLQYSHRVVYEALVGAIPVGLTLDHLCRVPACVNPDHLEPVTIGVNVKRAPLSKSGRYSRRTSCDYGHPFDEHNTLRTCYGFRRCRECHRLQEADRWRRRRRGAEIVPIRDGAA